MINISADDKGKGKRIILQFFKSMPNVQKALLALFEKDEYEGIQRLQEMLYPGSSLEINSVDTLRKGLSMILQHIYSLPFEDKEGYFLEVMKCNSAREVLRKEKRAFIDYFLSNYPKLKGYLMSILPEDDNNVAFSQICGELLGRQEEIKDLRNFKNNLRELQSVFKDRLAASKSAEDAILEDLKKKVKISPSSEFTSISMEESTTHPFEWGSEARSSLSMQSPDSSPFAPKEERRRIIETVFSGPRYEALRSILLKTTVSDPQFATFQGYLDNILPSSERIVANNLDSFYKGLEKIKEFRDNLEKELS